MIKHLVFLIGFSVLLVLGQSYVQMGLHQLVVMHSLLVGLLDKIFTANGTANLIKNTLALMAIPVIISSLISLGYWILKRSVWPYAITLTWILWLVLATVITI
jgi:hypothetical protein